MIKTRLENNDLFIYFGYRQIELFNILFFIFSLGFVVGVSLSGFLEEEIKFQIKILFETYTKNIYSRSIVSSFFSYYFGYSFFILVNFLVGFFPFGQPISLITVFLNSLGVSFYSSYIYLVAGFRGVLFCLICIYPCELIYTTSLILASKTSILYSNIAFKKLFPKKYNFRVKKNLKLYLVRFLFVFLFLLFAVFLNITSRYIFTRMIF